MFGLPRRRVLGSKFGARVSLVVYLGKVLEIKVGIHLGGADIGVAQKLLDAAQVMTGFQQMSGEGVPEQMRVDLGVYALPTRPVIDPGLHRAPAEAGPTLADEQ